MPIASLMIKMLIDLMSICIAKKREKLKTVIKIRYDLCVVIKLKISYESEMKLKLKILMQTS